MGWLIIGIISFGVTKTLLPMISRMIAKGGLVRPNYRQEEIPVAVGLIFWCSVLLTGILCYQLVFRDDTLLVFYLAFTAMTLLGLIDDLLGSREASGLKGHFVKLVKEKELTTGALKALGGGLVALLTSLALAPGNWLLVVVDTLIIALSTNAINLLDLRPGRAGKGFLLGVLILLLAGLTIKPVYLFSNLFLAMVVGSLLAYLPADLKAKVMMGDTGSNPLGATLGLAAVIILNFQYKLFFLGFLVFFHLYTEKYSLTKTIENNKFLKYLDMMGRD